MIFVTLASKAYLEIFKNTDHVKFIVEHVNIPLFHTVSASVGLATFGVCAYKYRKGIKNYIVNKYNDRRFKTFKYGNRPNY